MWCSGIHLALCMATIYAYATSLLLVSAALLGRLWIRTKQFLPVRLGGRRRQEERRFPRGAGRRLKISSLRSSGSFGRRSRPEWNASSHGTGDAGGRLLVGKCI